MAGIFLQPSDFKGRFDIGQNGFSAEDLQLFIEYYEKDYLTDLLGCELFQLFIDDLDSGIPQTTIYKVIYNALCVDNGCDIIKSEGMKDMLRAFIYFEFARKSDNQVTISGNTRSSSDNSTKPTQREVSLYLFYNEGLNSYKNIQEYICENITDYPTYNGQPKEAATWL